MNWNLDSLGSEVVGISKNGYLVIRKCWVKCNYESRRIAIWTGRNRAMKGKQTLKVGL